MIFCRKLKEKRKREQQLNKEQKEKNKEELKQKSLEGMKKKNTKPEMLESDKLMAKAVDESREAEEEDESDSEWYRKEVGQEPEEGNVNGL